MSLEQGCRERLAQTEDGRQALALLDTWEKRVALLDLVRAICQLRTAAYRCNPLGMLLPPPRSALGDPALGDPSSPRPWRELGFVEICATLGIEWMPDEWTALQRAAKQL
jgi:hypothetical protein